MSRAKVVPVAQTYVHTYERAGKGEGGQQHVVGTWQEQTVWMERGLGFVGYEHMKNEHRYCRLWQC